MYPGDSDVKIVNNHQKDGDSSLVDKEKQTVSGITNAICKCKDQRLPPSPLAVCFINSVVK
jgi:hypothetical protein